MVEVGGCAALRRDNRLRGYRIITEWAERSVREDGIFFFFFKAAHK